MEVTAFGKNYSISTKHSVAICDFIRGKTISEAINMLEKVREKKIAVPMRAEIGHRKGMERGRYPIKASAYFIKLLKNLRGNASQKNLEPETTLIEIAKADKGEKPVRAGRRGRVGKRTRIFLTGKGIEEVEKPKAKEKKAEKVEKKEEVKKPEEKKEEKKAESTQKPEEKAK